MRVRTGVGAIWLIAFSVALMACSSGPPNIVLISLDTVRADHLSAYGYTRETTPALDRFAARGAVFEHGYAQAPNTVPTHASLFTGRFPYQHGMFGYPQVLAATELTLAEFLAEHGYRTFAIASSVRFDESSGYDQGFESYQSLHDLVKNRRSEKVVDLAIEAARKIGDEPVFAFLHFFDAHSPYAPPNPYRSQWHKGDAPLVPEDTTELLKKHTKKVRRLNPDVLEHLIDLYDGAISFQDHWLEKLIEQWEGLQNGRPTLWIITSDHGEEFMEHQHLTHGRSLYEELVRVPFIVVYPGRVSGGQRIAEPIQSVDLFRTIAGLAGLPAPPSAEGRSFADRLTNGSKPLPFSDSIESLIVVERIDKFGIIADLPEGLFKWNSHRSGQLFNIAKDRRERRDVSREYPKIHEKLSALPGELELPEGRVLKARYRKDRHKRQRERAAREKAAGALNSKSAKSPMPDREMMERLRAIGYGNEVDELNTIE